MHPEEAEKHVMAEIEKISGDVAKTCRYIHRHPEPGLEEHKACAHLMERAAAAGFAVTHPVAGLETAFCATYGGTKKGPHIAFLAEYDALPELGHGCGHNIIAAASLGAALALAPLTDVLGGRVTLLGTPDEEAFGPESRGGKVVMVEAGVFDAIDAALMIHPTAGPGGAWGYTFPLIDFFVRYEGRPAHYTRPHEGVNALEALLLFLQSVNTMKREWHPGVMFAYTITDGGGPSAITVPASAEAHVTMKAFYTEYLDELFARVRSCAEHVGSTLKAEAVVKIINSCQSMVPNLVLTQLLHQSQKKAGEELESPLVSRETLIRRSYPGISTDFGDVSRVLPAIHGYCSVGPQDLVLHTPEFAETAGGAAGLRAAKISALSMALAGARLLLEPKIVWEMKSEFVHYRTQGFARVPGIPPEFPPFPDAFGACLNR